MIYILLAIVPIIPAYIAFCNNGIVNFNNNEKFFLISFLFCTFLVMALRADTVGADTQHYSELFNIIGQSKWKEIWGSGWTYCSLEIGYASLMKLCYVFVPSYYFFQIIYSILFSILSYYFIKNNCDNYFLVYPIYLGYYLMAFNIQRQMLAVMIAINAWVFIRQNKYLKALIIIFIAMTIHTSAILFIIAILFSIQKQHRILIRLVPLIIFLLAINFRKVLGIFQPMFSNYGNYYSNTRTIMTAGGAKIVWIVIVITAFLIIYSSNRYEKYIHVAECDYTSADAVIISLFSMIYVAFNVIGLYFNFAERLGVYFALFIMPMFNIFAKSLKNKRIRITYCSLLWLSYLLYFMAGAQSAQYNYHFFF